MIHIFLGTKAQLIKMAPIMRELQDRNIEYNFIFSGQHQGTIDDLRGNFGIKTPDIILHSGSDINSIPSMLLWMVKVVIKSFVIRRKLWRGDRHGIVLNHGDTFSTLLGTILGRLAGKENAHIESGLRSFNLFHPFPEEITRLIVFRLTHFYYCPSEWAISNLIKYKGVKIHTHGNTLADSLKKILNDSTTPPPIPHEPYAIVSIHRFENIFDRKKLEQIIRVLIDISEGIRLLFIMHSPTVKRLKAYDLYSTLENCERIELRPRYDYKDFISLVVPSEYVISDGGSNQEECYYLGKPCLLLREKTERQEGLGENVCLSNYSTDTINHFTENYAQFKTATNEPSKSPTNIIVDDLISRTQNEN
jgi:UDP-N-acetylglucosamine 2-epimerase